MDYSKLLFSMACACALSIAASTAGAAGGGGFSWDEKNGKIERKTVCANHGYGSIKYRECRARAAKYFKQRCNSLSRQLDSATGSNRSRLKQEKDKICYTARHFKIVN